MKVPESNGGKECEGEINEKDTCNSDACPIDCQWGTWDEWTTCTQSCGGGERERSRSEIQSELNGGKECEGNHTETKSCNEDSCPGNCELVNLFS